MTGTTDWDGIRRNFSGEQLRIARELRQMTQAEVAAAVRDAAGGRAMTGAAVSQFELGDAVPSAETLALLLEVLRVDDDFLTVDASGSEVELPAFFRSLRSTPAKDRKYARNLAQLVHRLAVVLDEHVGLPERDIPAVPCDPFVDEDIRRAAAEQAAAQVRKAWGLPAGPVEHVVSKLEDHGVICTRLRLRKDRVDAFSVNFSEHPIAVLATDKAKWDRSRFDAAHELGHLVMHDEASGVPEAERQANEFAAAFLMPAKDIRRSLPERAEWRQFMELKATWGVSIAALLRRARTLEVMSPAAYLSAMKVLSARGWRRHEPVDGDPELPAVLHDAMQRAVKNGVDLDRVRREASIPADIFDDVCALITPTA